jgi:hypothetical protein
MDYQITSMQPSDWPAVREIYAEGIATGQATFQNPAPRLGEVGQQPSPGLPADRAQRRPGRRLGRPQPSLHSARLLGSCGGLRLRGRCSAGPWTRRNSSKNAHRRIRTVRSVDAASRHFSRKRCQHRDPQVLRIPRSWEKTTHWQTRRHVERRAPAGATKPDRRHLVESLFPSN